MIECVRGVCDVLKHERRHVFDVRGESPLLRAPAQGAEWAFGEARRGVKRLFVYTSAVVALAFRALGFPTPGI
jgi:hypothetical protein